MNHDHPFDALAKAVAGGLSRRALLLRAGQGLLGSLVAATGLAGLALPAEAESTALSLRSPARAGRPDPALLLACQEVCAERDAAYTGFCARIFMEDAVRVEQQYEVCRAGCLKAGTPSSEQRPGARPPALALRAKTRLPRLRGGPMRVAGTNRERCQAECGETRAELAARVAASRESCFGRRASRHGACLRSCGG